MVGVDDDAGASALKTGDIVLFAGHRLGRGLISWLRGSPWTHVGLVLRAPDTGEPLLWEAGCAGPRRGTLVVGLEARLARFQGPIGLRCLNRALVAAQCEKLETLRRELADRPARQGLLDLMGAAEDGWLGAGPEALGDPMDGELVALAYQRLGLLQDIDHGGAPARSFRPWQFAERHGLELERGYALGPEIVLSDAAGAVPWSGITPQPA